MKEILGAVVVVGLVGIALWSYASVPVVQVSNRTKQVVACASKDTQWEMRPATDPVCVEIAKGTADVEWVK